MGEQVLVLVALEPLLIKRPTYTSKQEHLSTHIIHLFLLFQSHIHKTQAYHQVNTVNMHEALQKTYAQFANEKTEEQQSQMLRDTDAIMSGPATAMLARAGLDGNTRAPFQLLDTACGSGAVVAQLQRIVPRDVLANSRVLCADINEPMLDVLRRRAAVEGWADATEVVAVDAQVSVSSRQDTSCGPEFHQDSQDAGWLM
jgi:hypothetical protein